VGLIHGCRSADSGDSDGTQATRAVAHIHELSMLVKQVEPDGTLHLAPLA
jgi:putative aminopeptidase FrvX